MTSTVHVEYRDNGFWAYDVALGIFLKHLIDRANETINDREKEWLSDCVDKWRVNVIVSEFGLHLDNDWSQSQLHFIIRLIDEACCSIAERAAISADEIEGWNILDGQGVFARGTSQFPTATVVDLGHAIQSLLRGTLPEAPKGSLWFYGTENGRTTIKIRG